MDPATATTVLLVLGSAFGVMFATMTTLLVVSIRVQHRESQETREYVVLQIEKAMGALRLEFNERLDSRFNELMQVIEHNHQVYHELRHEASENQHRATQKRFDLRHEASENQHRATQKRFDRLEAGLDDVRERLARIEGHLGIGLHQQKPAAPDETNSDAA